MTITAEQRAFLETIDTDVKILVLVQGTLSDGSTHYAYASIPPSRYADFKLAEQRGDYDLAAFGTILAHGSGTPSLAVQQQMEREYGVDHQFENALQTLLQQAKR